MKIKKFMEQWENREMENRLLKFVIVVLAAAIVIEGGLMIHLYTSERTVIVPSFVDKRFYVEGDKASTEYIELMARYAIELVGNFTPDTIDERTSEFLRFINPRYYNTMATQMKAFSKEMKDYSISQFFIPQKIIMKGNSVTIVGFMRQFAQDKQFQASSAEYRMEYQINQGRFEIVKYEKFEQKT
jgi:conjugal transfer pilus assembly protein TraE